MLINLRQKKIRSHPTYTHTHLVEVEIRRRKRSVVFKAKQINFNAHCIKYSRAKGNT